MTTSIQSQAPTHHVWEDIVNDFLEIACQLLERERHFLIRKLRHRDIRAEHLQDHQSFSLEKKLVVVCKDPGIQECWVYFPDALRVAKYKIDRSAGKELQKL
ncbi:MAG: hypothetical protein JW893_01360 [Candidatus Omnitrophica bacterium]|nr:hypothetical protein [Candidatus Omnitrophota bacterium]